MSSKNTDKKSYCIGVDVGGTFTDIVLSDGDKVWRAKAPSVPKALGKGVLAACALVAERAELTIETMLPLVSRFGLGTTAVTNDIASRVGRKVGLITTKGFEDLVPIARVRRIPSNGWLIPPDGIIARECIVGVNERIDRNGKILQILNGDEVVKAAQHLKNDYGVEAIAISFLWSCVNPKNEEQAVEAIHKAMPDLAVVSGAALLPVMREYERSTFALLNAYTSGSLNGVDALVDELKHLGLKLPPLLVHSGGGSISVQEGHRIPVTLAESGPAAGVVGAITVCQSANVMNAVACDMGGTSFDMAIIRDGVALRRTRGDLMGIWTALPMVDIESVTAGGGSIGWVDSMGYLRAGPLSAGAYPGPACYGRGGTKPTVTDALVVLGYIDSKRFLGGGMGLDLNAALSACENVGKSIGSNAIETAWGIWEIARAEMTKALRTQFAQKGLDPRDHTIISMGGCGGLFTGLIAQELHMKQVLVPELTSVLSAFGAANADVRRERSHSVDIALPAKEDHVESMITALASSINFDLTADGISESDRSISFEFDLRFMRQKWELTVPGSADFGPDAQAQLIKAFKSEYGHRYGEGALATGSVVELATVRAIGIGRTVRAKLSHHDSIKSVPAPIADTRSIHIRESGKLVQMQVNVVLGQNLLPGHTIEGPTLIDGADTTIWIPPRVKAFVDPHFTIDMEVMP